MELAVRALMVLLLATLFSGCAADADPAPQPLRCQEGASREFTTMGGLVIDRDESPLAGVLGAVAGAFQTTTDEKGSWQVDRVQSGCVYAVTMRLDTCRGTGQATPDYSNRLSLDC